VPNAGEAPLRQRMRISGRGVAADGNGREMEKWEDDHGRVVRVLCL
jgi:hypothetical protein